MDNIHIDKKFFVYRNIDILDEFTDEDFSDIDLGMTEEELEGLAEHMAETCGVGEVSNSEPELALIEISLNDELEGRRLKRLCKI